MRSFAPLWIGVLVAPTLLAFTPGATANNEICLDVPGLDPVSSDGQVGALDCIATPEFPFPGGSSPTARATIYFTRNLLFCTYTWSTSVSAGSGLWTWTLGEAEPFTDQIGAVNDPGPISKSYSGPNLVNLPIPRGTKVTVVAQISGSNGQASSTAVFIC